MKADDLINATMGNAQKLEIDQLDDYFLKMAILSIGVMRSRQGEKFVQGFLQGAMEDKNPIKVTAHAVQ